jgi:hypothetical protein
MMTENAATVHGIYEAFGRGDVPAILARVAEDVVWEYGPREIAAPWLARRSGRDGAAAFFGVVAERLDFRSFAPKRILDGEDVVVVLVDLVVGVRGTDAVIEENEEIHLWWFDAAGQVCKFRHVVDTAQHEAAAALLGG